MRPLPYDQKQLLRRELEDRAAALRLDTLREREESAEYPGLVGEAPDDADRAAASVIRDLNHAEMARTLAELRAIERTLLQLERDDFGRCIDCGDGIAFARLRLNPTARRCTDCQRRRERLYADRDRPAAAAEERL